MSFVQNVRMKVRILVSHTVLYLHTMNVGKRLLPSSKYISIVKKKLDEHNARRITLIRHRRKALLDAVQGTETFVGVTFMAI